MEGEGWSGGAEKGLWRGQQGRALRRSRGGCLWLLAALVALGGLFLPMVQGVAWLRSTRSEAAAMAICLGAYFVGALAATEWGNFPVPVLGAGAGHVLGWYSALGILRYSMTPPTR